MGVNYTQTATTSDCAVTNVACSGRSASTTSGFTNRQATNGGTPDTNSHNITLASSESNVVVAHVECIPGSVTWNAGTWTVRFNVVIANMNLTWTEVYICRVNSSCTNQATIGSATGLGISLGSTGVKSTTVSGSAQTPSSGDVVLVLMVVTNGAMSSQGAALMFDQNIDSPFTVAALPPPPWQLRNQFNALKPRPFVPSGDTPRKYFNFY